MRPIVLQKDLDEESLQAFQNQPELAIDCEMMGLNPWRDRLCVVQIMSPEGRCVLVQIHANEPTPRLKQIFENKEIIKIFHYARLDILYLKIRLNIDIHNVYCTKIASRMARTYTERHGLRSVVQDLTGDIMDKTNQTSDWGRAELTPDQIHYAAYDVKYLFIIKEILEEMLIREDRHNLTHRLFNYLPTQRDLDEQLILNIFEH